MAFYATDTGIFAMEDALTLPPAPDRPSFSGIVADALAPAPGLGDHADASSAELGAVDPTTIEGAYTGTLGDTADTLASETDATDSSPAGDLLDAGAVVDARHGQVRSYLPGPDSTVPANFNDPPTLETPGHGNFTGPGQGGEPDQGGGSI